VKVLILDGAIVQFEGLLLKPKFKVGTLID
jgi:hypothetical protein